MKHFLTICCKEPLRLLAKSLTLPNQWSLALLCWCGTKRANRLKRTVFPISLAGRMGIFYRPFCCYFIYSLLSLIQFSC